METNTSNELTSMSVTTICRDFANDSITFTRHFDAAPPAVWEALSDARTLEKWWAPKPYHVETKNFDFRPGGIWHYAMVGPQNEVHWAAMQYTNVNAPTNFQARDYFTDEKGVQLLEMPESYWRVELTPHGAGSRLEVIATCSVPGDMDKLIEMGFEQGFAASLDNLHKVLEDIPLT